MQHCPTKQLVSDYADAMMRFSEEDLIVRISHLVKYTNVCRRKINFVRFLRSVLLSLAVISTAAIFGNNTLISKSMNY